jgi:NAD(P)-dependent dehydrogenase (short-subunit alcohol dehydrogenase family)
MKLDLAKRNVLVTGGSKGIGLACARAFLDEGAKVAIVSRSGANVDAALQDLAGAKGIVADLAKPGDATRAVDEAERALGPIDVLVNSAGAAKRYAPDEIDMAAWHAAMDAKFHSAMNPTTVVLPRMKARRSGVVVNIIGMGGKVGKPSHIPGGAANAALMLATAGLAAAYGPHGVRIVGINPGTTLTGRVEQGLAAESRMRGEPAEAIRAAQEQGSPMRRFARPEEIAAMAVFLASSAAAYVTGAIVPMDGGLLAAI